MERTDAPAKSRLRSLLVGESRAVTRRALALAAGFLVGLAALEYVFLLGPDDEVVDAAWRAFVLEPNLAAALDRGSFGAFLVVGLAAIHAYLNEGYLVSLLLASAPIFGAGLWSLGGPFRDVNFYLDPASAVRRTFPEALLYATIGFLLGLALRWLNRRLRARQDSTASS
jgi:DMSO/TMAO reductase YedYZ heme-binding membrane subunit